MAFEAGTRLGPYEILAPLGAGGMGEVYRARDIRLDRTVALKVLTGALAADAESRQRFEQEARAIAALNDPHICTIHDVGHHVGHDLGHGGDLDYLVLEFLEGETLAQRLTRSPALRIEDALAIAIQIGDALDRAHRAGIVHRDLKPGNVMLVRRGSGASATPDIKLLDFGLAAWTAPARPPETVDATLSASSVPTRTGPAPALSGFSGTVPYMAPERLDGDPGDPRADIFALGCVLYEMLAGRKAFEGASAITVIAAIMSSEPAPIAALQTSHPLLDHVMRRCLEKDRERRWQSVADVSGELRWIAEHPLAPPATAVAPPESNSVSSSASGARLGAGLSLRARLGMAAPALVVAIAAVVVGVRALGGREASPNVATLRFEVPTPPTDDPSIAISADGTRLAFVANQDRVPVLFVRALDSLESRPLAGTQGARLPFWSPDGRTIGFFADSKLKRVDITGGTPLVLADAPNARGGTWNGDGVILFVPGVSAPIMRVATRGGPSERVTDVSGGSGPSHRWPQFLPGGTRFLFSSALGTAATNGIYVGSLDKTPPVRVLASDAEGRFAAPDRLLTIRQGALLAYGFDAASGAIQGEPVAIAQGFTDASANGALATSETGVLAYHAGGTAQHRQLAWVNRQGAVLRAIGEPQTDQIASPELSADEQSVVVVLQRGGDNDIWTIELARNLSHRITDGPPADAHPVWDPDGQHVVFYSRRFSTGDATRQAINGGKAELLVPNHPTGQPLSWTRDREYILLRRDDAATGADLIALATHGEPREIVVARSRYDETEGQFSPDGRWVAFVSNESGRPEVFVQSFPDARARIQASTTGGTQVRWSGDGNELFYIAPDGKMTAVPIALAGATPDVKSPVPLFQTHLATGINVLGNKPQYAVARDGRFLLNTVIESAAAPIVVWTNWTRTLAR